MDRDWKIKSKEFQIDLLKRKIDRRDNDVKNIRKRLDEVLDELEEQKVINGNLVLEIAKHETKNMD